MKYYHFKKHKTSNGWELDSSEIFNFLEENTPDFNKWYTFIVNFIELQNWYNTRTSLMNGDVKYTNLSGWVRGFEYAMKIEEDDDGETITLYKGKRKILRFDKIPLSQMEIEQRIDNAKTINALLGY